MSSEEERSQLLAHFQEVTGITDLERSRATLASHDWNLEAAVQDALNFREGRQPVFSQTTTPSVQQPRPRNVQAVTLPVQAQAGWWEWLASWAFLPVRVVLSMANELLQLTIRIFFGFQPAPAQNALADVRKFISNFENEYGQQHPPFLQCTYGEALDQAKRDLHFLLVYLHSSGHQDTAQFCSEVLCSAQMIDFLKQRYCLVWGVGVDSEEGTRVSYVLRETHYPFLALIMCKGSRMTVIGRIEGYHPLDNVIQRLQGLITNNEPELVVLRTERENRTLDQQLREQQEREFLISLQADQEKEKKRVEEQELAAKEAEEERERKLSLLQQQEAFERERVARIANLPPPPPASDADAIHIVLKMPDGQRKERRFYSQDSLQSVYDFALTYDQLNMEFTLLTSYPRKELVCREDGGPLLSELNLGKKCLLVVQDNSE